jgi:replicative DNA helicase
MARRTGASGIILSQLSREIDKRASRRPVLADLRDSGAIEADADVVIFLHNPAVVDEKSEDPCELIVSKQRNGRLGAVLATWEEHGFYVPLADNDATHGRAYSNEAPAIPGAWNEPKINGVKPKDEEYVPF